MNNSNSGIYQIKNIINGKIYIGQSMDVLYRLKRHYKNLINGRHKNRHLQFSFNKYGEENFEYSVLRQVSIELLDLAEMCFIYILEANVSDKGFNESIGGEGGFLTEEIKRKISISNKKAQNRPEVKEKQRIKKLGKNNAMFGKHHTEESLKQMSDSLSKVEYKIIKPDGSTEIIRNLTKYCLDNNLNLRHIFSTITGERNHHKGFRAERVNKIHF